MSNPERPGERQRPACQKAMKGSGERTAELQLGIGGDERMYDAELELGGPAGSPEGVDSVDELGAVRCL